MSVKYKVTRAKGFARLVWGVYRVGRRLPLSSSPFLTTNWQTAVDYACARNAKCGHRLSVAYARARVVLRELRVAIATKDVTGIQAAYTQFARLSKRYDVIIHVRDNKKVRVESDVPRVINKSKGSQ